MYSNRRSGVNPLAAQLKKNRKNVAYLLIKEKNEIRLVNTTVRKQQNRLYLTKGAELLTIFRSEK